MSTNSNEAVASGQMEQQHKMLFWACFAALVATSFGFIIRVILADAWGSDLHLTQVEKGQILGAGLWPFAISIILFSLIIDRIGYGVAMGFAFVCHVLSVILSVTATSYNQLYIATFIVALANGTVEAVINPVVATMFPTQKVRWLNILHAGWPGGLVLGGIFTQLLGPDVNWKSKFYLLLVPTVIYGIMMLGKKFPVQERVAAKISYREMLREFGFVGAFLCAFLVCAQVTDVFHASLGVAGQNPALTGLIAGIIIAIIFGAATGFAPGRGLFIFLMLVMIPLATTELGVDSWVTSLMTPEMGKFAGWVLVYTSFIMMLLRFGAGAIVHRISPLGLLALSATIAMVGLFALSSAAGIMIVGAATLYAMGKTFFWPTTLGVVSEQSPRGGALTINAIAGVGMLGVGILGAPFLGYIQDNSVRERVEREHPQIYQQVRAEKPWLFGKYEAVIPEQVKTLPEADQKTVEAVSGEASKHALVTVCLFPLLMVVSYVILLGYFKSKGGYQAEVLTGHGASDEEFTGGVEGPVEA
jgi:MFS family permease